MVGTYCRRLSLGQFTPSQLLCDRDRQGVVGCEKMKTKKRFFSIFLPGSRSHCGHCGVIVDTGHGHTVNGVNRGVMKEEVRSNEFQFSLPKRD